MPSNIVSARVPLIDPNTGLVTREWYRYFENLAVLTDSGPNNISITDLMLGPSVNGLLEQIAALQKPTSVLPVIDYQEGVATTGGGSLTVAFAKTFTVAPAVVCTVNANGSQYTINTTAPSTIGFTATSWLAGATTGGIRFSWIAIGS